MQAELHTLFSQDTLQSTSIPIYVGMLSQSLTSQVFAALVLPGS